MPYLNETYRPTGSQKRYYYKCITAYGNLSKLLYPYDWSFNLGMCVVIFSENVGKKSQGVYIFAFRWASKEDIIYLPFLWSI